MRPLVYDIDLPDVDPNGIAEDQQPDLGTPFVLNGALCDVGTALQFNIGDTYSSGVGGVIIVFESAGNWSGVDITVTGKNQDGISTVETLAGPNATSLQFVTYWSEITEITTDGTVATDIEVGTVDEITTKSIPINWRDEEPFTVAATGVTGTVQFDIDESFDSTSSAGVVDWLGAQTNKTADLSASLTRHARVTRLKVDSYSSGAELKFHVIGN
jgi:hypothetical protein